MGISSHSDTLMRQNMYFHGELLTSPPVRSLSNGDSNK